MPADRRSIDLACGHTITFAPALLAQSDAEAQVEGIVRTHARVCWSRKRRRKREAPDAG